MFQSVFSKWVFLMVITGVVAWSGYQFYGFLESRNNAFTLTYQEITTSLSTEVSQCSKFSACELFPGDVLIRRYVTSRTRIFDYWINPYFTHSAFYLGDDLIVEAVGREKNIEEEIKIAVLSASDWFDEEMINFVVIRPEYHGELPEIKTRLIQIANDPGYTFGLPGENKKQVTCADLIFSQFLDMNMLEAPESALVITPDYLYSEVKRSDTFNLRGFYISD